MLVIGAPLVVIAAIMANCGSKQLAEVVFVHSDKARNLAPVTDEANLRTLTTGNSEFAFDLYRVLSKSGDNLFFSPYSISVALAMTYAGARNETEREMADTLHFTLEQDLLHPTFNALDLALASRGQGAKGQDGKSFRLKIVNSIWGALNWQFLSAFLDVLAESYGAGLRLVDFQKDAELARVTINAWVSDQTEGKIEDLIPRGAVNELTKMVLVNAIYFNAAWAHPFDEKNTRDGPFHLIDGRTITVPMMFNDETYKYAAGDGCRAVELPYDGEELALVILVPDAGRFLECETSLDVGKAASLLGHLESTRVQLRMPRFTSSGASFSLKDALSELGMPVAFDQWHADFSGMDGKPDLYIKDVIHKAYVSVNEKGTEAAASTAVIINLVTAPAPVPAVEFTVDRPFIYLIRDIPTGSILFMGRMMNPAA